MEVSRFQKPSLIRQFTCPPDDMKFIDTCILDNLRHEYYQCHTHCEGIDHAWIKYARLREPERTQDRAEFYPEKKLDLLD